APIRASPTAAPRRARRPEVEAPARTSDRTSAKDVRASAPSEIVVARFIRARVYRIAPVDGRAIAGARRRRAPARRSRSNPPAGEGAPLRQPQPPSIVSPPLPVALVAESPVAPALVSPPVAVPPSLSVAPPVAEPEPLESVLGPESLAEPEVPALPLPLSVSPAVPDEVGPSTP